MTVGFTMKFVDANVFIYAYSTPKRALQAHEVQIKSKAKQLITKIQNGEGVFTSVVHLSEVLNYLEDISLDLALEVLENILNTANIQIETVTEEDYYLAQELAKVNRIGINDSLALHLMEKAGLTEIYSFDRDFDQVPAVKRREG